MNYLETASVFLKTATEQMGRMNYDCPPPHAGFTVPGLPYLVCRTSTHPMHTYAYQMSSTTTYIGIAMVLWHNHPLFCLERTT